MKLLSLIIIVFILYYILNQDKKPTQSEIQKLDHAKDTKTTLNGIPDFPYPQFSRGFKRLNNEITQPLNTLKDLLPNNKSKINIIRDTPNTMNKKRIYVPDFYRKDRMNQNDIGNEEVRPFVNDNSESETSWTDKNVSSHPKFYTSDIQNELTNVGMFFDKNNQYNDKTSANTEVLSTDKCYQTKNGETFCQDNTRLQNIPPSLITDIKKCNVLNSIGIYKKEKLNNDIDIIHQNSVLYSNYLDDKLINGGNFYNEVYASKQQNSEYSKPLETLSGNCSI